jgi:hypothetical protein
MSDEEFVSKYWEVRHIPQYGTDCALYVGGAWEAFEWAAAAEFTRAKLEQIRQVVEEIAYLLNIMGRAKETAPDHCVHRVLAREQDALTELKRGMRHE